MGDYGYLHIGRVINQDEASGGYYLESVALARDRKWGPCPSCVAGLQPGDRVVMAATGTSRDNLIILGALDPRYPDISDIPGLTAALAAKADQTALDAVNTALDARLDSVEALDVTQNSRLTSIESLNTTQNTRLDGIDTLNTTQNTRLTTAEGTIVSHTGQISAIQQFSQVFQAAHEFDVYGDLYSSFPRIWTSNIRTLTPQAVYIWRTRVRVAAGVARLRVIVQAAGTGAGSCTASLLTSSTAAGPYTLAGTANNTLTATGAQDFTFTSANVSAGTYIILMLWCNNSYTVAPKIVALQNAVQVNAGGLNPTIVFGVKTGQASPPTSITITDGTWTADNAPIWIAAAN